jgi:hypothetical protein
MLLIPVTWLFIMLVLLAIGGSAMHFFNLSTGSRSFGFFHFIWLGYAVLIAFLQWYSVFFPVNGFALCLVVLFAASGGYCTRHRFRQLFSDIISLPAGTLLRVVPGLVIVGSLIAYHASLSMQHYDTELYHLNAVKWAGSYPAVPGIVNLHGRLAFNSSFHLFAALLDTGYWSDRAVYLANSVIVAIASMQWFLTLAKVPSGTIRLSYCFALLTSPFLVLSMLRINLASLSTDLPSQILILVVIYYLLDQVELDPGGGIASTPVVSIAPAPLLLLLVLSAVIASTKLSGAIILAIFLPAAIIQLWTDRNSDALAGFRVRDNTVVFIPALIVVTGMIMRYVILSGWLIYPLPFGNLHLDWSAHPGQVANELDWIRSWARMPGKFPAEVLGQGFLHWFLPWYDLFFARNRMAQVLLCGGLAGLLYLVSLGKRGWCRNSVPLLMGIFVAFMGLVYWFVSAPDYRFGEVFFWAFTGTTLAPLAGRVIGRHVTRHFLTVSVLIFFLALQKLQGGFPELFPGKVSLGHLPASQSRKLVPVRVNNGQVPPLLVYRPLYGDRCGNSPLPCAPAITKDTPIELRTPGDLRSGFRLR